MGGRAEAAARHRRNGVEHREQLADRKIKMVVSPGSVCGRSRFQLRIRSNQCQAAIWPASLVHRCACINRVIEQRIETKALVPLDVDCLQAFQ